MRFVLSVVLSAFSVPALAVGVDTDSTQGQTVAVTKTQAPREADEPKICKRIESTESRLGAKKICMTAAQWKEYNDANSVSR